MIKGVILDGGGTGKEAFVDRHHCLHVTTAGYPPLASGEGDANVQKTRIFRQYLTADGEPDGVNDMRTDGSITSHKFYVGSDEDNDRYLTTLSFMISDAAAKLADFGAISPLTNGCRLYYEMVGGEVDIHEGLKTNFEFIRLCLGQPAFGTQADVFRAANVIGSSEAFIPILDITRLMPPYGIQLQRGTTQKLIMEINDDITAIDGFDCIVYGFERLP